MKRSKRSANTNFYTSVLSVAYMHAHGHSVYQCMRCFSDRAASVQQLCAKVVQLCTFVRHSWWPMLHPCVLPESVRVAAQEKREKSRHVHTTKQSDFILTKTYLCVTCLAVCTAYEQIRVVFDLTRSCHCLHARRQRMGQWLGSTPPWVD